LKVGADMHGAVVTHFTVGIAGVAYICVVEFLVHLIHSSNNLEWQITEHERIFG
jgi:hypothetical protein